MSDHPATFGRISIDLLPTWALFPLEKQIVARPSTRVGGMTISLGMLDSAPVARSHLESLRLVCQFLPSEAQVAAPMQIERISWPPRLCGAASFKGKTDFYRIWYVHEGTSLVPALYACKLDRSRSPDAIRELIECRQLASSIKVARA